MKIHSKSICNHWYKIGLNVLKLVVKYYYELIHASNCNYYKKNLRSNFFHYFTTDNWFARLVYNTGSCLSIRRSAFKQIQGVLFKILCGGISQGQNRMWPRRGDWTCVRWGSAAPADNLPLNWTPQTPGRGINTYISTHFRHSIWVGYQKNSIILHIIIWLNNRNKGRY